MKHLHLPEDTPPQSTTQVSVEVGTSASSTITTSTPPETKTVIKSPTLASITNNIYTWLAGQGMNQNGGGSMITGTATATATTTTTRTISTTTSSSTSSTSLRPENNNEKNNSDFKVVTATSSSSSSSSRSALSLSSPSSSSASFPSPTQSASNVNDLIVQPTKSQCQEVQITAKEQQRNDTDKEERNDAIKSISTQNGIKNECEKSVDIQSKKDDKSNSILMNTNGQHKNQIESIPQNLKCVETTMEEEKKRAIVSLEVSQNKDDIINSTGIINSTPPKRRNEDESSTTHSSKPSKVRRCTRPSDKIKTANQVKPKTSSKVIPNSNNLSSIVNHIQPAPSHERSLEEQIKLNEEISLINQRLLSEMFTWTTFRYLNQHEQEILWLVELSALVVAKISSQLNDDERTKKLAFEYICQFMSSNLRSTYFNNNYRAISDKSMKMEKIDINSNSMLVRYGIRHQMPNIKIEFIGKRKEAKSYMQSIICKRYFGQYLSTLSSTCQRELAPTLPRDVHEMFHCSKINKRWFQLHDEDENKESCNDVKFKRGDLVYLYEDPMEEDMMAYNRYNQFQFWNLSCYHAEILAHRRCTEGEVEFVTYSVLLRHDSSVEHGIVAPSIFNRSRMERQQTLQRGSRFDMFLE